MQFISEVLSVSNELLGRKSYVQKRNKNQIYTGLHVVGKIEFCSASGGNKVPPNCEPNDNSRRRGIEASKAFLTGENRDKVWVRKGLNLYVCLLSCDKRDIQANCDNFAR